MTASRKAPRVDLYGRVRGILESARVSLARTVNTTRVVANSLIVREIDEDEQSGRRRGGYGAKVLAEPSARLTQEFGRGYSVDNLEAFRQFYLAYPRLISETVFRKSLTHALHARESAISSRRPPTAAVAGALLSGRENCSMGRRRHALALAQGVHAMSLGAAFAHD